tara:strand:+ start:296 stop:781 length:486 start_codon:yes stop_codon:yes gene_type:complete
MKKYLLWGVFMAPLFLCMSAKADMLTLQQQITCLTEAVYFEARGENFIGQLAVANVILNRVRHVKFPNTICDVVHEGRYWKGNPVRNKCQFSYWCDGKSEKMKDKTALEQAKNIAILSLAGARIDRMENVLYYHASYMRPYWISYVDRVEKIGTHIFYRSK